MAAPGIVLVSDWQTGRLSPGAPQVRALYDNPHRDRRPAQSENAGGKRGDLNRAAELEPLDQPQAADVVPRRLIPGPSETGPHNQMTR